MNATVIPIPQSRLNLALKLVLLGGLHLLKQEPELLSKRMEALPPMAAAVLIFVADEDLVEEFVDILKHCLVMRSCHHKRCGGDDGWRRHLGLLGKLADSHGRG